MIIAQISDSHLEPPDTTSYLGIAPDKSLINAVEHINNIESQPDLVVLTGDCVNEGKQEDYEYLKQILDRLQMPYFVVMGNHDDRDNMRAVFQPFAYFPKQGFIQYTIDDYPLRLIILDTMIPNKVQGVLCQERLSWLTSELEKDLEKPTVIFQHHPPARTGMKVADLMKLKNEEEFKSVISKFTNIQLISSGHYHRSFQQVFSNVLVTTCPSTVWQLKLDLSNEDRFIFLNEPPGCLIHFYEEGMGLVSHLSPIGDFPLEIDIMNSNK